ncbi:hypothetical protein [Halosolutus gelatinilyticus]|uniref:hypothetical protein n=1 Tax=Halosolutus gelatinilyticus TaxID=2931975 RepID=UPI001FF68620|nr:hypothetical protein [Halosolutus gelatinilyticus]
MSTDRRLIEWPDGPAILENPLIGLDRRRTTIAIAYVLAVVGLFAASYAGGAVVIDGTPLDTARPSFDTISAVLIALATATMLVVPLGYAAWNGGPALSFALPLVPVLLADAATGRYVLDLDVSIALTVGAAACALAVLSTDVRRRGTYRPWRYRSIDENAVLFVTAATIVAGVGVRRFLVTAPAHAREWYLPYGACWLVPVGILVAYWYGLGTSVANRTGRQSPDR